MVPFDTEARGLLKLALLMLVILMLAFFKISCFDGTLLFLGIFLHMLFGQKLSLFFKVTI